MQHLLSAADALRQAAQLDRDSLVGEHGLVRGVDSRPEALERLVERVVPLARPYEVGRLEHPEVASGFRRRSRPEALAAPERDVAEGVAASECLGVVRLSRDRPGLDQEEAGRGLSPPVDDGSRLDDERPHQGGERLELVAPQASQQRRRSQQTHAPAEFAPVAGGGGLRRRGRIGRFRHRGLPTRREPTTAV